MNIASNLTVSNEPVAVFTVPDGTDVASEFTASIDWGDGNSSSGTIQELAPGLFQVLGSHTYAVYDWYTMTVTLSQGWQNQEAEAKNVGENGGKPIIKFLGRIPGKNTLQISKWEGAFTRWNPGEPAPIIRLVDNFVNVVQDNFRVLVYDPVANKNPAAKDAINVNISTPIDERNNIVLEEDGNDTGIFLSDPLLLATFNVDKDENPNHIFLDFLGGTVRATYDGQQVSATVPVKKVVKLHINVLSLTKGGPRIVDGLDVDKAITWANKIYAQVGIRLEELGSINFVNPPPGLDLSNGLLVSRKSLTDQENILLGKIYHPRQDDHIEVYFVNYIKNENNGDTYHGLAVTAAFASSVGHPTYADSIILEDLSSRSYEYGGQLLAHEIGHILGVANRTHPNGDVGVNQVNLMAFPKSIKDSVTDSRRISVNQAIYMLSSRPNLLLNP